MLPSLTTFRSLSDDERLAAARACIADRPELELQEQLTGAWRLAQARHRPTDRMFVLVPGGRFEMGLRDADLEDVAERIDWTDEVERHFDRMKRAARPVHDVEVAPFLCDRQTLRRRDRIRLSGDPATLETALRADALAFVAKLGLRLPSEAELEYLARAGGSFVFVDDAADVWKRTKRWPRGGPLGVEDLSLGEWAADDWHASYDGAPGTSKPWMHGEDRGVFRGELPIGPEDEETELVLGLAAHRKRGSLPSDPVRAHLKQNIRLAMDLDAR